MESLVFLNIYLVYFTQCVTDNICMIASLERALNPIVCCYGKKSYSPSNPKCRHVFLECQHFVLAVESNTEVLRLLDTTTNYCQKVMKSEF